MNNEESNSIKRQIAFSPPDITEAEIDAVGRVLKSGWITTGPVTKALERSVAAYCHTSRAACMSSNTACAETTLRLLGIGAGDEVIVPAYTYTATASVVAHVGAKIVMADCERGKFTPDYDQIASLITERTKAIIPVDLFGIPADYDRLYETVERKRALFRASNNDIQKALGRIIIIGDAAHSFGALYRGAPVGSVADFTNFSFHAVKNLTTAEGGASVWRTIEGIDDEEIYRRYMLLSLHGQTKDALAKTKQGSWEYDVVIPGYKCNMTDIHAAIGLCQLRRYDKILARRKEIIERFDAAFADAPFETPRHYTDDYASSGHVYAARLSGYTSPARNKFIEKMAEDGIAANVHYKPLPLLTAYKKLGFRAADFPNAVAQYENEVTLPLHTKLSDEDVEYVIEKAKKRIVEC